ncbi:hypothetical protein Leryth_021506 [Lithospermum erythrorhizon]|nr:hypothetical protein Leryth_021506 [Lithospermum erythrorhizon]
MDFDSNYGSSEFRQQFQHGQTNPRGSLLRFRSAPGSLFANFTDGLQKTSANVESYGFFPSRINLNTTKCENNDDDSYKESEFVAQSGTKVEDEGRGVLVGYAMNSQLPPQYPRQVAATQVGSIDAGYRVETSMGLPTTNLLRQNSSPAGYATISDVGSYRVENASNRDLSRSSGRLRGEMNYSSGLSSSSLGMLSRISESENENYGVGTGADDEENLGNGNGDNDQFYSSSYPFGAWNDSLNFEENLTGIIKREVDDGVKSFGDLQTMEVINRPPMLSHHLSLPKTSSEMAAVEKVLQFQDTIPCKIRAKRGCATHPRSIAERVRRTKISERMRKLQDLVPNMDKQTNTADMLDLAVEYIKDLQQQHKNLADARSNCTCTTLEKQV